MCRVDTADASTQAVRVRQSCHRWLWIDDPTRHNDPSQLSSSHITTVSRCQSADRASQRCGNCLSVSRQQLPHACDPSMHASPPSNCGDRGHQGCLVVATECHLLETVQSGDGRRHGRSNSGRENAVEETGMDGWRRKRKRYLRSGLLQCFRRAGC